jgi:hypothetical protein
MSIRCSLIVSLIAFSLIQLMKIKVLFASKNKKGTDCPILAQHAQKYPEYFIQNYETEHENTSKSHNPLVMNLDKMIDYL